MEEGKSGREWESVLGRVIQYARRGSISEFNIWNS